MEVYLNGKEISTLSLDVNEMDGGIEIIYPYTEISSIIIYDESAPYPEDPKNSPYIHFLSTNIKGSVVSTGDELFSYVKPSPPKDSKPHRYIIKIYEQDTLLYEKISAKRNNFDLTKFEEDKNPIYETYFIVHNSNGYVNNHKDNNVDTNNIEDDHNDEYDSEEDDYTNSSDEYDSEEDINENFIEDDNDIVYDIKNDRITNNKIDNYDNDHNGNDNRYCNCVLDVIKKQPKTCLSSKDWFNKRQGKTCYNPWAVCASTTKRSGPCNYKYEDFDSDTLERYSLLNKVPTKSKSRKELIMNLYSK